MNTLPSVYNYSRLSKTILTFLAVIERFEEAEQRKPGELSIADLPAVLKLKKELCEAQVWVLRICYCSFVVHFLMLAFVTILQSVNESHIPNALLERLVTDTREFPPVCPIIGGILGQVLRLSIFFHIKNYSGSVGYRILTSC